MESLEIMTMRFMALERAKGELKGVLNTFWKGDPNNPGRQLPEYEKAELCINTFITDIQDILE